MRTCEMCDDPVVNNNNSRYCLKHAELATLALEVRQEVEKSIDRGGRQDRPTLRLFDLWQSLSDEARFVLSIYAAQVWRNVRQRPSGAPGFGAIAALAVTVCIFQELEATK